MDWLVKYLQQIVVYAIEKLEQLGMTAQLFSGLIFLSLDAVDETFCRYRQMYSF
jgi:hypothetical protein